MYLWVLYDTGTASEGEKLAWVGYLSCIICSPAIGALAHVVSILLGYVVLRSIHSDPAYHSKPSNVARVAAVGGAVLHLIGSIATAPPLYLIWSRWLGRVPTPTSLLLLLATLPVIACIEAANSAAAGALGVAILHAEGTYGIDRLHAARMGAVGAGIAWPILVTSLFRLFKRTWRKTGMGQANTSRPNNRNKQTSEVRKTGTDADVERGGPRGGGLSYEMDTWRGRV